MATPETRQYLRDRLAELGAVQAPTFPEHVMDAIYTAFLAIDGNFESALLSAAEGPINIYLKYRGTHEHDPEHRDI